MPRPPRRQVNSRIDRELVLCWHVIACVESASCPTTIIDNLLTK